ncbi:hypothetical protein [Heliothis virescens ascovirus 3e]|uniref:Uncharacterized protein n=1 Tax=Heliothis virescens ascovirus 3e TaxID=260797 RepID=A4KXN4_HVAVE|nr:hypothetical protein HVAV3e_gp178 [Heliothis virescens ascovirus 3e]ABO37364.1 hypothetical protein [Heliothis virescens ascovirus 3e]
MASTSSDVNPSRLYDFIGSFVLFLQSIGKLYSVLLYLQFTFGFQLSLFVQFKC